MEHVYMHTHKNSGRKQTKILIVAIPSYYNYGYFFFIIYSIF